MKDKGQEYDLEEVTTSILESALFNIVHDIAIDTIRKEKLLLHTLDPKTNIPLCLTCGLPRLLDPPLAISTPDKSTQYCSHVPWSRKAGHDIYGNPFPLAGSEKPLTKKEREARVKADREERQRRKRNGSSPSPELNVAGGPVDKKSAKVGEKLKTGNYTPWHTCPSCKRSLLITRFAQHLEKCLGIGGRSRRDNKDAASGAGAGAGSGMGTPGSGIGTPKGMQDDSATDDDRDDGVMRKKVLKKALPAGKKDGPRNVIKLTAPKHKISLVGAGTGAGMARSTSNIGKRDHGDDGDDDDDDEDVTPLRKKQKTQRTDSSASFLTQMTAGSVDNEQSVMDESIDGSFVAPDDDEDAMASPDD